MLPEMSKRERAEALRVTVFSRGWQDVIRPALLSKIDGLTDNVMNGTRDKGDEEATDNELKNRVAAYKYVLSWEKEYQNLVHYLDQVQAYRDQTKPAEAGGSPY